MPVHAWDDGNLEILAVLRGRAYYSRASVSRCQGSQFPKAQQAASHKHRYTCVSSGAALLRRARYIGQLRYLLEVELAVL